MLRRETLLMRAVFDDLAFNIESGTSDNILSHEDVIDFLVNKIKGINWECFDILTNEELCYRVGHIIQSQTSTTCFYCGAT